VVRDLARTVIIGASFGGCQRDRLSLSAVSIDHGSVTDRDDQTVQYELDKACNIAYSASKPTIMLRPLRSSTSFVPYITISRLLYLAVQSIPSYIVPSTFQIITDLTVQWRSLLLLYFTINDAPYALKTESECHSIIDAGVNNYRPKARPNQFVFLSEYFHHRLPLVSIVTSSPK
jgi:hypothetical protein